MKRDGVKGLAAGRQTSGRLRQVGEHASDIRTWACQFLVDSDSNEPCQLAVDQKAFTGRGTLHELRHWIDKLAAIETEMESLHLLSKQAASYGVRLTLHRRAATGSVHLRWREHGASNRHLLPADVEALVAQQGQTVNNWIKDINARAQKLNAEHVKARVALRGIRVAVRMRLPQPIFPRSITVDDN